MNLAGSISLGPLNVPVSYLVAAVFAAAAVIASRVPLRRYRALRSRVTGLVLDALVVFVVAWKLTPALLSPARLVHDPFPVLVAAPGPAGAAVGAAAAAAWLAVALVRRRRLRRAAVLPVVIFAALLAAGAAAAGLADLAPRQPGPAAPPLALAALDGNTVDIAVLRGRVVVVNFWATWCPPCRAEQPDLAAFDRSPPAGALLVSVDAAATETSVAAVKAYVEANGIRYPVLMDTAGAAAETWGIRAWPTTVVLDPQGRISVRRTGAVSAAWLRREVRIASRAR